MIPCACEPTSMKMNAKIPTENIASATRVRVLSVRMRPTGKPMKIVKPAIAPRPTVFANGRAAEARGSTEGLGAVIARCETKGNRAAESGARQLLRAP